MMRPWILLTASLLIAAPLIVHPAHARIWTDASGSHEIDAELVGHDQGLVILRTKDGRRITVPLDQLSQSDQDFIAGGEVPSDPADEPVGQQVDTSRFGPEVESTMVKGLSIINRGGEMKGVSATIPVPADWPEQKVEILETKKSRYIRSVKYRTLEGGSKQLVLLAPTLPRGVTANIEVTFRLKRRSILPPPQPDAYRTPTRPSTEIREYLKSSPGIQTDDKKIRAVSAELKEKHEGGWALARATYDWVKENLRYTGGELRGALWAAEHGEGDCEEYTSLFIAICRANRIPARAVWVPGHCYPEFYLEDAEGRGRWFPCEPLADDEFGKCRSVRPILQKGDNFKVPEKPERQRYLAETLTARDVTGSASIEIRPIFQYEAN